MSVAGGLYRAFERGAAVGCTGLQIFTRNQRQWQSRPLSFEQIYRFKELKKVHAEIRFVLAHGSYLVNPAADCENRPDLTKLSVETMLDELNRCAALDISFLIVHPGSHGGAGESEGVVRVVDCIERVMEQYSGDTVLLIETTAGQGTGVGYRFEHIRDIIGGVHDQRIGACIDTCHIFSAGYDIRTSRSYRRTMHEFNRVVGLSHVKAIHLNDSKGGFGARTDRHMHIGRGEIGLKAFSMIMRDRRFTHIPKILETPKKLNGKEMDRENIDLLRGLSRNNPGSKPTDSGEGFECTEQD